MLKIRNHEDLASETSDMICEFGTTQDMTLLFASEQPARLGGRQFQKGGIDIQKIVSTVPTKAALRLGTHLHVHHQLQDQRT